MNIEELEIRKEDTEQEIKKLHSTANILSNLDIQEDIKKEFIKRIEKEIEWNEIILSELDSSLSFKLNGYDYSSEQEDYDRDLYFDKIKEIEDINKERNINREQKGGKD